ncbi:AbiEi antitoxin N-terminal domain-containing protein [Paracoccus kondratievae]
MATERSQNLKKVLDAVPTGYLIDAAWLTAHGVAYETFRDYVKRGWLERVTRGLFRRPFPGTSASDTIDWKICLLSVQHIMRYDAHVGGMTALAQQGHGHYLRLGGNAPVWVYGEAIPNWLSKLPLNAPIETRSRSLLAIRSWAFPMIPRMPGKPFPGLAAQDVVSRTGNPRSYR